MFADNRKISCFLFLVFLILCFFTSVCRAAVLPSVITEETTRKIESEPKQSWLKSFEQERQEFEQKYGTSFSFLFHSDQQLILSAKNNKGKGAGLYYWDLEVIQKPWPGGSLAVEFEVDRGKGADKFIPSFSVFNDNSGDNIDLYVPELYFEQDFIRERGFLAAGKLDLSDWFDDSAVAACGDTQFLSNALINNIAIPFPSKGLGAMLNFKPCAWLYFQAGAATARSVATRAGLRDGFNSAFFIGEFGLTPVFAGLAGNYRFIFHHTHRPLDLIDESGTKKDIRGFSLSFDQALTGRITLFVRYGFQNSKVMAIEHFWSAGAQLNEPFAGRKDDFLGLAVAQSITGKDYRDYYAPDVTSAETIWELYYSYDLNHVIILTPHIQVMANPEADRNASTAVVAGVRILCSF